jgi:uncharacterized protein (DUF885 family)
MSRSLLAAASAAALLLCGCASTSSSGETRAEASAPAWPAFSQGFIDGYFRINPAFAVNQGKHEYDGRLPDWSETGLANAAEFLRSSIAAARAFDERRLSKTERFERDYLIARARGDLFWLETADQPHRNPAYYMGNGLDPSVYVTRPYAPAETRLRAFIAYLKNVPRAAQQIRANLKAPLPLSFINYGKAGFGGFAEYYPKDGRAAFAEVRDPALQAELDKSAREAARAMQGLADWLEAQRPNATQDFALGADRFAQMLRDTERVDLPLAELEAIGRADLKRNQDALRASCARYAPGATLQACMNKMAANKPKGGAVQAARAQLAGSQSGSSRTRTWSRSPAPRRPGRGIAALQPAEFRLYRHSRALRARPPLGLLHRPARSVLAAEVQAGFVQGEAALLFTSVHEVWPGHFLNFLHSNRSPFTFGRVFVGYAFAEGFAHYAEEMMWDAGPPNGDLETHIGQISNALLRDCRYFVGDRDAHRADDDGAVAPTVPRPMLPGRRQCPAAERPRAPTTRPISTTRWASS